MADYYIPEIKDLYVGMPCERHVWDWTLELCTTRYGDYCLMGKDELAECGEHLAKHFVYEPYELTQKDIDEFSAFIGDIRNGPGMPMLGFIRVKKKK